ncbi:unnamed protein product [Urochloa humidicola]
MGADGGANREAAETAPPQQDGEGEWGNDARVFRRTDYSITLPSATLAIGLWLGGMYLNVLLVLIVFASLLLLSLRVAAMSVSLSLSSLSLPSTLFT